MFASGPLGAQGLGLLTQAQDVRALSAAELDRHPRVRLRGVVTFHEPESGITYLQDETAGVALAAGVPSRLPAAVQAGTEVEVEGVAAPGAFAPVVTGADGATPQVSVLGTAPLPEPLPLVAEQLSRGAHDGRWIELRGIVRSLVVKELALPAAQPDSLASAAVTSKATRISIELGTVAGRFTVIIPWQAERPPPEDLVEARVRVRGVLGSIANSQRQWMGVLIFVPSLAEVRVERPPAADPFLLPVRPVNEILRFSAAQADEERVRVQGQVTLLQPGYRFFLRSDAGALEVQTPRALTSLRAGTWVDVVGHPALLQRRVILQDALFRVLSNGPPPAALGLSRSEILARYADGELVRLTGRLFQNTMRGAERVLMVESEGQLVEAIFATSLAPAQAQRIAGLRPGAELELTGIAQVLGAADWSGAVKPLSLSLLLRGFGDVRVRRQAPFWTTGRLLGLVGVLLLLIALGAGWVAALRRQVAAQTAVIRDQAAREANERERRRIAQDIHDDLGSRLTQLALLGARVRSAAGEPATTAELGERISATARATVQTMDEIVWAVNPGNDTLQSLGDYLCKVATAQLGEAGIRCLLDVPPVLPERMLSAEQRHNLALAVREALHNVVKHARATEAGVKLSLADSRLQIVVHDNGVGFDPAAARAGNGLANLRRRLGELGGDCHVETAPGAGTRVRLTLPLAAA